MPKNPKTIEPDTTSDDTYDATSDDTRDAINPGAPEGMESKAQELVSRGIEPAALVVKIYDSRGATPGTPGKYLATVSYANFSEEYLAQTHGPGLYIAHLQAMDARARGTQRVARLEIATDARAAAPVATPTNTTTPAAHSGDLMHALLIQLMQNSQTTQLEAMRANTAMIQALAARPTPDMSGLWTAIIGVAPQIFDMLSKRAGGGGGTIAQLRELAAFMEERGATKPANENTGQWILETILPAFMQFLGKDNGAPTASQQQRPALPPPAATHPAPTTTEQPTPTEPASAAAAPSEAQQTGTPEAGNGLDQPPPEAAALVNFANMIAPILRAAGLQTEPDTETYAEVVYDMAHAYGVAPMFDPDKHDEGTLTAALEAMHKDLEIIRTTVLLPVERHLRRFLQEDRQAEQDEAAGQLRIGNANEDKPAKKPRKATNSPEGQKGSE